MEGNINHVRGLRTWSINVALLRDGAPVLAAVFQPADGLLYMAARGRGAYVNDIQLRVSGKKTFDTAVAATGQAEAGQVETYRRLGDSVAAMLGKALLVQMSVPCTFPILLVASGQNDVFWQYMPTLSGVAPGVLLAQEAGAIVTRIDGTPWTPEAADLLIATPLLHADTVAVLRKI